MQAFTELFLSLDQSTKTGEKHKALVRFFNSVEDQDALWAIALFTGKKSRRPIGTKLLHEWAAEVANIPLWLFEESYQIVGDLAETISLVAAGKEGSVFTTLTEAMLFLQSLKSQEEEEQKASILHVWKNSDSWNLFVFNKLMSGGFRVGVSDKLVIKALAESKGLESNQVAYALMGNWTPATTSLNELLNNSIHHDISKPYPFCLAYALDQEPHHLGSIESWQAEYKWDGIRVQLIKRKEELFLWSRGEELISDAFPDFLPIKDLLPNGCVIDAELLAYKEGNIMDFQSLQKRLGRKKPGPKTLRDTPVSLMAYDLLEWNGNDMRTFPLEERRPTLHKLVDSINSPLVQISPVLSVNSWDSLQTIRSEARAQRSEGLMLKLKSSTYGTGRKRGDWWKWKLDPLSIDAVLLYAQKGHGKRANLYTDYTFAVWDGDQLVPFAKAYSGLSDKEIAEVDSWIKQNTKERFGPVRSVEAELVFEIAFEGINLSSRHKSGVAVRFPRILRWRMDKKVDEANSLEDLKSLLNNPV